jgi:quercetin dioxygenase-like cupin family protein
MERVMAFLIRHEDLELGFFNPKDDITRVFQGEEHGVESVSCILSETPPGLGAPSHRHPYPEVFVIHEGHGTFTVEGETVVAGPGDIVVVPPNASHEFINDGDTTMRHTSFHSSGRIVIE